MGNEKSVRLSESATYPGYDLMAPGVMKCEGNEERARSFRY